MQTTLHDNAKRQRAGELGKRRVEKRSRLGECAFNGCRYTGFVLKSLERRMQARSGTCACGVVLPAPWQSRFHVRGIRCQSPGGKRRSGAGWQAGRGNPDRHQGEFRRRYTIEICTRSRGCIGLDGELIGPAESGFPQGVGESAEDELNSLFRRDTHKGDSSYRCRLTTSKYGWRVGIVWPRAGWRRSSAPMRWWSA